MSNVSPFHLMARPEIKQPSDLIRKFALEPGKGVALLPTGTEAEAFAALQAGSVHVVALAYPSLRARPENGDERAGEFLRAGLRGRQRRPR